MTEINLQSRFKTRLLKPLKPLDETLIAFIVLPKEVSEKFPRRGRTSAKGKINGHNFQVTLEPDGKLSHWFKIDNDLLVRIDAKFGDTVTLDLAPVKKEPEPLISIDFQQHLKSVPEANIVWNQTTTIARVDWIHWIESAKQHKTRNKRINDACDMLASGNKRVCCFDQSGFYSKAMSAPKEAGI